jgi:aminomethyltransferase
MAKKTSLYDEHVRLGAKIVEFAGYLMPIQYTSILQEHRSVRTAAGMFDVSHMGEFIFRGPEAEKFLQYMTINDVSRLAVGQAQYSAMCYDHGGIVDDLLVYRYADHYMMVVNAANIEKDWNWLVEHKFEGVELANISDDVTLIAVQGPRSLEILQPLTPVDLSQIRFYHFVEGELAGFHMTISRTGYTGELGFELYMSNEAGPTVWRKLLEAGEPYGLVPVGLGARDTLRLEMKYCLYGNDIDETTNPLEAGLGWITKLKKGDFIGREALIRAKEEGIRRKLIGFRMEGQGFPRHGYKIFHGEEEIGYVTSGTISPMLNVGIGMGYVEKPYSEVGTELEIEIRKKRVPAVVVETPFYRPEGT